MMSPRPPSGRCWKMGRMAWVMLMRPVTLVEKTTSVSCSSMSGARATPLTRPLGVGYKRQSARHDNSNPKIQLTHC